MDTQPPARIVWGVDQLNVDASDRILEIGCGSGHAVRLICPRLRSGTITGIDRSAIQARRARVMNEGCIASGRARIEQASLDEATAALGKQRFDKILAINVNVFWTDPASSFANVEQLLDARGQLVLIYEPPSASQVRKIQAVIEAAILDSPLTLRTVRTAAHCVAFIAERSEAA